MTKPKKASPKPGPKSKLPPGINEDPNNLPDCDCGYFQSDWMPHHADYCVYLRHGKFHQLEVETYSLSLKSSDMSLLSKKEPKGR